MDDPDLIRAALGGDESSFEELIRAHSRRLYAVAFGVLQNRAEAEDVVQDTFLKAWRDRRKIRDASKFSGWLTATARNRACDVLRRRRGSPLPDEIESLPDESVPPAGADIDHADRREHIGAALASLPETHRVALSLRYLEGMDCRSIENTMGLTSGALRGILARALERLRAKPELQQS
jgi:RNA polymerase sigma factor, sigma-70 family